MENLYAPLRRWPADDIGRGARNGLDYQGRHPEFADTYPTEPAPLHSNPGWHVVSTGDHGAAHVCTEIDSDRDDAQRLTLWQRIKRFFVADYTGRSFL